MNKRLKCLGALMLLGSLALPIARGCARVQNPQETADTHASSRKETSPSVGEYEYVYVLKSFDPADTDNWATLLIFVWPTIAVGILAWRKKGVSLTVRILEPFLITYSFVVVNLLSTFFTSGRAIGAYVAFTALGIYAVGALWSDVNAFQEWRSARKTSSKTPKID